MPRFKVVEVEGYSEISSFRLGIGVSVLDTAYNYAEVARFRSEHEQRRGGRFCTTAESWARARKAGHDLAAELEDDHAA